MAIPLPVTPQPLATPFLVGVLAEAAVVYPEAEANDVQAGYYFNDPIDSVDIYPGGRTPDQTYYDEIGCLPPQSSVDDCEIPVPVIGIGGFVTIPGVEIPAGSVIFFQWVNVADFFWYWPDGDVEADPQPPGDGGGGGGGGGDSPIGPECVPVDIPTVTTADCSHVTNLGPLNEVLV